MLRLAILSCFHVQTLYIKLITWRNKQCFKKIARLSHKDADYRVDCAAQRNMKLGTWNSLHLVYRVYFQQKGIQQTTMLISQPADKQQEALLRASHGGFFTWLT